MRKFNDISAMRKLNIVLKPCNTHFCKLRFYLQCALIHESFCSSSIKWTLKKVYSIIDFLKGGFRIGTDWLPSTAYLCSSRKGSITSRFIFLQIEPNKQKAGLNEQK